jgi:hypothetical protein
LVEELSKRIDDLRNDMNHRFGELRNEMNNRFEDMNHRFEDTNHRIAIVQWEVRIWFLVLMALITILTFLKP